VFRIENLFTKKKAIQPVNNNDKIDYFVHEFNLNEKGAVLVGMSPES
jgi:hypothetical protein